MSLPLFLIFSVVFTLYILIKRVRAYRRLAHIPGPKVAGWSRAWMVWANGSGRNHEVMYDVTVKYGSLARIGPNHLLTSDPEIVRRMQAARSPYRRSPWYSVFRFKPRADSIISTLDEEKHDELRRKMAPGYSGKELPCLEEKIDNQVQIWMQAIKDKYISTAGEIKPMELARATQYFTLDVISDVAFSRPFGDLPADEDKFSYLKVTEDAMAPMVLLALYPTVHRWFEQSRLIDLLAPKAVDKTGLGPVIGVVENIVSERFDSSQEKPKQDMLDSFIRHGLKRDEAVSETVLQILAGSETTATAIRTLLLHLLTTPKVHAKLRAEIDAAIRSARISSPTIRDAEAKRLPYLQACIKETFRLYPPVTNILQKVVAPQGDTIAGHFVPGGTFVGTSNWALGRDAELYGPDCALFRPERWLEAASDEKLLRMERTADLAFGYGRFKCLGQPVALMELNKVFVELLRRFDITVVDPSRPWKSYFMGIFFCREFWVRVTEREDLG